MSFCACWRRPDPIVRVPLLSAGDDELAHERREVAARAQQSLNLVDVLPVQQMGPAPPARLPLFGLPRDVCLQAKIVEIVLDRRDQLLHRARWSHQMPWNRLNTRNLRRQGRVRHGEDHDRDDRFPVAHGRTQSSRRAISDAREWGLITNTNLWASPIASKIAVFPPRSGQDAQPVDPCIPADAGSAPDGADSRIRDPPVHMR